MPFVILTYQWKKATGYWKNKKLLEEKIFPSSSHVGVLWSPLELICVLFFFLNPLVRCFSGYFLDMEFPQGFHLLLIQPSWHAQQLFPSGGTCLPILFFFQVHFDWLVPPNFGYSLHPGQRYPLWAEHHQAEPGSMSTTQCAVWLVSIIWETQDWCYPTDVWVL